MNSQKDAGQLREARVISAIEDHQYVKERYPSLLQVLESNDPSMVYRAENALLAMANLHRMWGPDPDVRLPLHLFNEATYVSNLNTLAPKVMDVVRIFYPNMVLNELMDIQVLDRQNGEVFTVKPVYSSTAGGVTAGQEVFKNPTDGNYGSNTVSQILGTGNGTLTSFSGTLSPGPVNPSSVTITAGGVTGTDNGSGAITGSGISSGTINYATGAVSVTFSAPPAGATAVGAVFDWSYEVTPDSIREMEIQLGLLPVQAGPHPLRIKYSTQSQLAAAAHLNVDVGDTLSNLVASFIKYERDIKGINLIVSSATADSNLNFDATPPTNYSRIAKYGEIEAKLDAGESAIQALMGRGGVSFILCGNNASDVWRKVPGFQSSGVVAPIGPHKIGTVRDGTVAVVKVPSMNTNTYVIGFKGYAMGDSSTILAEWIPLYASPVFNSHDLNNYQGMLSLYAMVKNQVGYYRKGTISNYAA